MNTHKLSHVLAEEKKMLQHRRAKLFDEEAKENFDKNKFGIALSGGGIRSATINLGFLKTLNLFKILEKADYISTVSGGGYTGAYVQATLKQLGAYDNLFDEKKIAHLRSYGNYWIPGQRKIAKIWNAVLLTIGYLISWVMSSLSLIATVLISYLLVKAFFASFDFLDFENSTLDWNNNYDQLMGWLKWGLGTLVGIVLVHFILNLILNFNLGISKLFTKLESVAAIAIFTFLAITGIITYDTGGVWTNEEIGWALAAAAVLFLLGYILNPNSLSFHRYYRKQLADAFLKHAGSPYRNLMLKDVFQSDENELRNYLAPYPLINTCLNLQNPGGEDKFKGAKASDYFLLSPAYCGSKLSKYVKTAEFPGYKHMTLPAALTISAAAVNPGMGMYSNKFLSILMTLFNVRLGFWVNNPDFKQPGWLPGWARYIVWWPSYFFKELFSKIDTKNRKLNISDGGHIENLAVYELLRRKCRLILAVDAGADPQSTFADLENLSIRARNELGIDISFRADQDPVDIIRPKASSGYANKRFAIADLMKVWEEFEVMDESGNPVTFKKKYRENGTIQEEKEETTLEALVNYFYSKNDRNILKFRVDLKAEEGLDFTEERFKQLLDLAIKTTMEKLHELSDKKGSDKIKIGTLVYIKSSVTSPRKLYLPKRREDGSKNPQFDTFKYKIYHPDFPHESTADQFFDPVQWESYFQLGQYIGKDVLNAPKSPSEYHHGEYDFNIDQLISHFDDGESLFKSNEKLPFMDVSHVEEAPVSRNVKKVEANEEPSISPEVMYDPELAPIKEEHIAEQMQFKI
ncbi:MAG: hypothetical protein AAFZ15_09890 [Bacteroidota bacterium]